MPDLAALYKKRAGEPMFQQRDDEYSRMFEYYRGGKRSVAGWSRGSQGKPTMMRDTPFESSSHAINITAQLVNHFTAMFAHVPAVHALPLDADQSALSLADRETQLIKYGMNRSGMAMRQPQQSFWFSLYGDCVYAVDVDAARRLPVFIRTFDPKNCYPRFSENDLGAVDDMLIVFKVEPEWVFDQFGIRLRSSSKTVNVYHYWDKDQRQVQVEEFLVSSHSETHNLGFVPFRWAFSRPMGDTGMSDVRDIPALQDAYNEIYALMMDSVRKYIEPAYWATGVTGTLTPIPGKATGLPDPNAKIEAWPQANPPSLALDILGQIMNDTARLAGISPISLEGTASGSIVTGRAVRNQVEAIESRAETKKTVLEATFARLGEYMLRILEQRFPEKTIMYQEGGNATSFRGDEAKGWYECEAVYGDLFSVNYQGRVQTALQGLGRMWDERYAINLADPDVDATKMVARISDYQQRQAALMGSSQAISQLSAQKTQEQSPGGGQPQTPQGLPPGQGPQPPQGPTPPGPGQFMTNLSQVEQSLLLVKASLVGAVWAVGELAIVGMAPNPMVMVEKPADLPKVEPLLQGLHGQALPGEPEGIPARKIA